jgi:preprotein translocase subunit SecF
VGEDRVRQALPPGLGDVVVQRFGPADANEILIRLPITAAAGEGGLERDEAAVLAALREKVGAFEPLSSDIVGPAIGSDLQRKGIWATVLAQAGILVYIGMRFRFSFAAGAVLAVFHDLLVTLACLVWFDYELSLNIVAALLTITGYQVNDTIVVFDRVRENQRLLRREPLEAIVNRSVNDTLSRTIITAGTTFLAVLALYLFGGDVLEGFAFTMIVGIVVGTYSTVFIASAVAIMLNRPAGGATQAQARARRPRA